MPSPETSCWILSFALGASAGLLAALCVAALLMVRRRAVRAPVSALWGQLARVSVQVPRAGVGRIAARRAGHRVVLPARALEGETLGRGRVVVIVALERGVALVTPFEPVSEDEDASAELAGSPEVDPWIRPF